MKSTATKMTRPIPLRYPLQRMRLQRRPRSRRGIILRLKFPHCLQGKFMFGASDYPYTAEMQEAFPNHMVPPSPIPSRNTLSMMPYHHVSFRV